MLKFMARVQVQSLYPLGLPASRQTLIPVAAAVIQSLHQKDYQCYSLVDLCQIILLQYRCLGNNCHINHFILDRFPLTSLQKSQRFIIINATATMASSLENYRCPRRKDFQIYLAYPMILSLRSYHSPPAAHPNFYSQSHHSSFLQHWLKGILTTGQKYHCFRYSRCPYCHLMGLQYPFSPHCCC